MLSARNCFRFIILEVVCLLLLTPAPLHASENDSAGFDVRHFLFGHIEDAYSWHICSTGTTEIAIPLPVIVYSRTSGWHCFMSCKLDHGATHCGFYIASEGEDAGKLLETDSDGIGHPPAFDLSVTKNVCALFISLALMLTIFLSMARAYSRRGTAAPKGLQSLLEPVVLFIRDEVAIPSIGKEKYERYLPYLLTIFFFILINNLLGLLPVFPGGANVTGNIAVTMVLAVLTFIITNVHSTKTYWKDIFNTPGVPVWLKLPIPIMPVVELMGLFTKPFVLMIRLFANITAGHLITLAFFSLIFIFGAMKAWIGLSVAPATLVFTIFMTFLELLVAFIQAYVFTSLSAVYFGMSAESEKETTES